MIVWLNGSLLEADVARIDPSDRGFTLGDGLFETIAVRGGKILRLDAHRARLQEGCAIFGLPCPETDLAAAIESVLTANRLSNAAVRLTLTRGPAPRGVLPPKDMHPTLLIGAEPLPPVPAPARCIIATVTRRNEHSPLARVKSLNYLDNILARQEAAGKNADEAILLNTQGRVAEASAANLFLVKGGKISTPPVEEGALPGVMRAAVLKACNGSASPLMPEELFTADGVFLTNSFGIRLVMQIDGKPLKDGARAFIADLTARSMAL